MPRFSTFMVLAALAASSFLFGACESPAGDEASLPAPGSEGAGDESVTPGDDGADLFACEPIDGARGALAVAGTEPLADDCPNEWCLTEERRFEVGPVVRDWHLEVADYDAFVERAAAWARPITKAGLVEALTLVRSRVRSTCGDPLSSEALAEVVVDRLNVGFLVRGLRERPLRVTVVAERTLVDRRERELLFEDPWVGTFHGVLYLPREEGQVPAVIAVHGHRDGSGPEFFSNYGFEVLPWNGIGVLALSMRVDGDDDPENETAERLLLSGFTLAGLRNYETLLALEYLEYLPEVDGARVGLIGHSGGSSACNLLVNYESGFAAYVSDYEFPYGYTSSDPPYIIDETVPGLFPYHERIADLSRALVPTLRVEYGYGDDWDRIVEFFSEHLL